MQVLHMSKKSSTFVADFKTDCIMLVTTISSYCGFGHNVRLQRRDAVARCWAVIDNRRVVLTSMIESVAKEAFLNHVATIMRQLTLDI